MNSYPIISIMTLFIGAFLVSLVGRKSTLARNIVTTIVLSIPLILMILLIRPIMIDGQVISYWMGGWKPTAGWAIGIGIEVDALSLFFGLIVTVALFIAGIYSFTYMNRDDSLVNYYTLFLMLGGSVLGLVLSGDLFNIFVMVEIMTFTSVALTAFRNDEVGALEGAFKYLVVGSIGSTCVLTGVILVYAQLHTLNLAQIANLLPGHQNIVTGAAFAFLIAGFASKAFLFPFQPLAADAHAVAPAPVSMMISGVLTKCGVYGIIRVVYILYRNYDKTAIQMLITLLGCITMFVCVTMAFNQHNFKRLLAFHSISQVGYVITAIGLGTALGMSSGLFHAVNHTIFKGLLFLCAGAVQYSTGSLDLNHLGGLSKKMPHTTALFLIGAAAISGIPPFNGFASKWMIYQAAFEHGQETGNFFFVFAAIVALITSILTLASFVKVSQSVFFGQLRPECANAKEVPLSMRIPMGILATICIILGVLPDRFADIFLKPAAGAALNAEAYISQMLGGTAVAAKPAEYTMIGSWSPLSWLLLLFIATCGVALFSVMGNKSVGKTLAPSYDPEKKPEFEPAHDTDTKDFSEGLDVKIAPEDSKYEPFFSGEESSYSQVGGSDLFWGFKHSWRGYFKYWRHWHSGTVNDYSMYAAAACAILLLYCIIFL